MSKISHAELFGIKINIISKTDTIQWIEDNVINHSANMQHIVVNVAKVVKAQKDKNLKQAINNSDIVNIDGKPIVWVLRLFGYRVPHRVTGVDLFQDLVKLCAEKGYRPYFLGARKEVIQDVVKIFKEKYPKLKIAGYRNGYFGAEDEDQIAEDIKNSNADMLFLGITSPKKELFIDKYTKLMNVPFTMGVGGSFDIVAGRTKRAPKWMQECGMEWFYRILQEPRRMWKRYAVTNTIFIGMVIKEMFRRLVLRKK